MKKKSSVLLGVLVALVFAFALTACGKVSLKLTFKVDGVDYATISTSGDEVIKMPEIPQRTATRSRGGSGTRERGKSRSPRIRYLTRRCRPICRFTRNSVLRTFTNIRLRTLRPNTSLRLPTVPKKRNTISTATLLNGETKTAIR